ncbi:hypothetical protein ABEY41_12290 [Peribacillus butanolivorans]|uniref:hypothetical protein n=1 Tax=Peribacillus butanolivorans TaxID=421767 RepID=UPI003D26CE70
MLIEPRKPSMTQKFMFMSAPVALGLSLFASTSASAERNEHTNKKPSFEFGLITNIQYYDCDAAGVRYYQHSISKLQEATAELNRHDLKFTVQMGDMINRNVDRFNTILPYFNKIEGPKYNVLDIFHDNHSASSNVVIVHNIVHIIRNLSTLP